MNQELPTGEALHQLSDAGGVLKNRSFLYLWIAQAVSQTALNATVYILIVKVEEWTGSSTALGLLILSFIIPSVVMGVAAGVFVDRWEKKRVMLVTNLLRMVIVASFIPLGDAFVLILLINLAYSVVSQFFAPAEIASIPALVPRGHLLVANGLFNLTMSAAQLAGFIFFGPILLKSFGGDLVFGMLALSYAVCALLISLMRMEEPAVKPRAIDLKTGWLLEVVHELREGWNLMMKDSSVSISVFHLTLMNSLILIIGMLAPGYVSRVLGIRADDAVFVMAPAGIGMVIGIWVLPKLTQRWPKEFTAHIGVFGTACVLYGLALVGAVGSVLIANGFLTRIGPVDLPDAGGVVLLVMLLALALGIAYSFANVSAQTLVQERTPFDLRGRVFATQLAFANTAAVFPLMFLGSLADIIGINQVSLLTATVVLVAGIFSALQTRKVRALGWQRE